MLFNQKSPVHREVGFPRWHKHKHTQLMDLETESAQRADSDKMLQKVSGQEHKTLFQMDVTIEVQNKAF